MIITDKRLKQEYVDGLRERAVNVLLTPLLIKYHTCPPRPTQGREGFFAQIQITRTETQKKIDTNVQETYNIDNNGLFRRAYTVVFP